VIDIQTFDIFNIELKSDLYNY